MEPDERCVDQLIGPQQNEEPQRAKHLDCQSIMAIVIAHACSGKL